MSEPELQETTVLEAARKATGLDDFGGDDFRPGLAVLLETFRTGAGLTPKGRKLAFRRVVQLLATRLRVAEALRRHPEIRERPLRRPVYLTGLPRTGTSALFNLLGSDPAARPLLLWEGIFPDPMEGLEPGATDPRYEAVKASYDRMRERDPGFTKIHFASADTPEECVLLLAHAFRDAQMGIEVLMEPYASWFRAQDLRPAYCYYRTLLQMLDWQRPGARWLLKSPAHLWALDALAECFPDVCIVMTHRDPLECVPSYCSMMQALLRSRGCAPLPDLGERVLDYLAASLERGLAQRDRLGRERFFDVDYRSFVADPLATVEPLYDHFGLERTPDVARALRDFAAAHPQSRHGEHRYDLERYGLTTRRIETRLAGYIERFGLAT
ncbi:MAG: sulfotransferase [Myxococcota bacterium]